MCGYPKTLRLLLLIGWGITTGCGGSNPDTSSARKLLKVKKGRDEKKEEKLATKISKELQAIIDDKSTKLTEELLNAAKLKDDVKQALRDINTGQKPIDSILPDSMSQQHRYTALHQATLSVPVYTTSEKIEAEHEQIKLMAALINRGADPNKADASGRRPLHIAAGKGNLEVVKFLLAVGANPNTQTTEAYRKETVLHTAVDNAILSPTPAAAGGLAIIKVLLQKGAKTDTKDRDGNTPLQRAESANAPDSSTRKQKAQVIALLKKA